MSLISLSLFCDYSTSSSDIKSKIESDGKYLRLSGIKITPKLKLTMKGSVYPPY